MADSWTLAVTSVVTFLAALVPAFADLAGRPINGWRRTPRALAAAGLLIVSVMTGWASWSQRKASALTSARPAATSAAAPTMSSPPPETSTQQPEPAEVPPTIAPAQLIRVAPRLRIADANGVSVSQLVAAAKDLRREYALSGVLQERSEQTPELQDLYTVHLTLTATVTRRTEVVAAFSVRSRGGGFQIEAARAQALDRLATTLQERLQEVP